MSLNSILKFHNMELFGYGPNVMKKNKVCPHCGLMVNVKTKSCPECGNELSNESLYDKYKQHHISCPNCGTILSTGSQYCSHCGIRVIQDTIGKKKDSDR